MTVKIRDRFQMHKATPGRSWFNVQMAANDSAHVVNIFGVIGDWEVDPILLVNRLQEIDREGGEIELRIDSPGGSVPAGVLIMSAIGNLKSRVVAKIWGTAYSMASMIAMACDEVQIAQDASMMIHKPQGGAWGTDEELEAAAQYLRNVKEQAIDRYAERAEKAGHTRDEVEAAVNKTTYYTSLQAIEFGLADTLIEGRGDRVAVDPEFAAVMLADMPDEIAATLPKAEVVAAPEVVVEPASSVVEAAPVAIQNTPAVPTADAQMIAAADPLVVALKSCADEAPVMTAKPDGGAVQIKGPSMEAQLRQRQLDALRPKHR